MLTEAQKKLLKTAQIAEAYLTSEATSALVDSSYKDYNEEVRKNLQAAIVKVLEECRN